MITKEEFEKAVEVCTNTDETCEHCPLSKKFFSCGGYLTRYIKENELALSANSTSSEVVSKDTDNIHLDDSTLLDICQEELKAITVIALNDYPNGYLTGYIVALKKNIERLRGEQSD
ncbi:hypothetical protein [Ruminococcus bicirculans (ex Wegman et al. 2014)]|uniref:hypothetical protein n=1 Tax=Ruminococcus bicirculans (ex Wegman et al. 2014) TaxID=1160721 RepID=UPI0022E4A2BC|nr:hypothetical protein [Ruminococcus bicirculans (ex Wegman et al. 2014)]